MKLSDMATALSPNNINRSNGKVKSLSLVDGTVIGKV